MKTGKIELVKGDITQMTTDAIVNAANSSLLGGGGVDGAIHRVGGPAILEECRAIVARQGGCKTGEAVITHGGNLAATFVIHTVGPVWNGGGRGEPQKLAKCYESALTLALENRCRTVAFPNISSGVYGFPKEMAADIALETVSLFLKANDEIERVIFVCFDDENFHLMQKKMAKEGQ
jgi:O-acetyl-ADP-ribose deacetylase (regulator of RNase III)